MKLLHTSDLHIGKRVNGFSMLPDQAYILEQVLSIVDEERPDAVLISGDVYDKTQPPADAVRLLDEFLTQLVGKASAVFLISGNHDSPDRLDFGSRIMREKGLYIAGVFNGRMHSVELEDENGAVCFYLLPFVKPALVSPHVGRTMESYDETVREVIAATGVNGEERNVLLAHQFVTAGGELPERSDSEAISIGGVDNVDASAFPMFDYVALGHLHGPQRIGRDTVRYAGSPLKYSFSEVRQKKSVTIVELGDKGAVSHRQVLLHPLRDMRKIKGPIEELIRMANRENDDYISATLTDAEEPYDAIGRMRAVYPNLMCLEFGNGSEQKWDAADAEEESDVRQRNPMELFESFYQVQNGEELNERQLKILEGIMEQAAEQANSSTGGVIAGGEKI